MELLDISNEWLGSNLIVFYRNAGGVRIYFIFWFFILYALDLHRLYMSLPLFRARYLVRTQDIV